MRIITFLLLMATGLGLALPGAYLATIGGSLYYVVAGVLILLSAILVLRRRVWGICLYWAVLLATFAWSTLSETLMDPSRTNVRPSVVLARRNCVRKIAIPLSASSTSVNVCVDGTGIGVPYFDFRRLRRRVRGTDPGR